MFKTLAFIKRKVGFEPTEFRAYYETRHIALMKKIAPSARNYRRNYVNRGEAANVNADDLDFDVVTELEFADRAEYEHWAAGMNVTAVKEQVTADLSNFVDLETFRVCVVEVEQ